MKTTSAVVAFLVAIVAVLLPAQRGQAESTELRVAGQFGIGYLPFMVMKKHKLIEKHAAKNGLQDIKVNWLQFGGGSAINEALISGNLDFAAAGVPVFLALWNKTKDRAGVRVAAGLNNIPVFLNTVNPNVRSIKDLTDSDKIALPAVKVSLQAMVLQMAASKEWGPDNFARLDGLTVSMKHPDAMIALLSGKSEITAHFTAPPFMFQELERPGVRLLLSSADVLGRHSFNVIYTSLRFREQNPRLYRAYLAALDEAMEWINADKRAATQLYMDVTSTKPDQFALMYKMVTDPRVEFTTVPNGLMKFAEFMNQVGTLSRKPASWQELSFPEVAAKAGS